MVAFAVFAVTLVARANTVSAAAAPAPSPTAEPMFCPVQIGVTPLDADGTRYAIAFSATQAGIASGTASLYAGDQRYDIPFHGIIFADAIEKGHLDHDSSQVVTVAFPSPTPIDSGVVTMLAAPDPEPCAPFFSPWVASKHSSPETAEHASFVARARTVAAIPAPAPVSDPVDCTQPSVPARTIHAAQPYWPVDVGPINATAYVAVLVGPDDAIVGTRIQRSSGNGELDMEAVDTTRRSAFRAGRWRCRPIYGVYVFSVGFNRER
ncbi:MAG TPA: hypothetical protein VMA36_21345 [Candidatus Limnocylindria bacterium]|nr:hypothetical protein [Candidatus Limnocylindria bacterium]